MIELEIDGQKVDIAPGSMVMDAAAKLGLYVPHFCYHKKLSIAANCRMCLVEVEKAPKPLPACATPVSAGMRVFTASPKAKIAQKGVMEFLLINHPLDCPICDQGGECQLQDLAMGYGPSASRYTEEKRVVFHKPLGPLISAQEMSRCIHCTRCVRFGQEIAGVMELGMAGRGEHSEIMSFVGGAVESELSGNMIDVCPVGALTSKPFRYQARTWELARRRSVSPHDGLGANIVIQAKNGKVLRVVPFENEQVNECWISDRDRYGYEGLDSEDRLTVPMVRGSNGRWREVDWQEALAKASEMLKQAASRGPNRVRSIASPMATFEELTLLARLTRGLQSDSVDFRPGLAQAKFDGDLSGTPHLGMPVEELSRLERVFLVGSLLRAELPLAAQRLRQAARSGAEVSSLHALREDLLMPTHQSLVAKPSDWAGLLAQMLAAAADLKSSSLPAGIARIEPSEAAKAVVASLAAAPSGQAKSAIFAGAAVLNHPQASQLLARLQALAEMLEIRLGLLPTGANGVGGYLAGAHPKAAGFNAYEMFADSAAAYLLMHLEPALDLADGPRAVQTLKAAAESGLGVVALTAYKSAVADVANVMLPITPFSETSGSFVNVGGRLQSFQAAVPALGQSRPGWKVLRVLGNLMDQPDFDFESSEDVLKSQLHNAQDGERLPGLSFRIAATAGADVAMPASQPAGFERLGDTPVYLTDAILRRAEALSQTRQSQKPRIYLHPSDLKEQGLANGMVVSLREGRAEVQAEVQADDRLAQGVVRLATGHPAFAAVNRSGGQLELTAVTRAA